MISILKHIYLTLASIFAFLSIPASAEDVLDFGWCNDWMEGFACFSGNNMGRHSAAIELPPAVTTQFDGKKITAVKLNSGMYDNIHEYTLFACHDLDGDRIMTQDVTVGATAQMEWCVFPLDAPIVIEGGKSLFVGFDMDVTDFSQNPYWVDKVPKDEGYGCWVNYAHDMQQSGWVDFNYHYGSLLMRVEIEGVTLPDYDAGITGLDMNSYVQKGTPFDIGVRVINKGGKPISKVTLEYSIGDGPAQTTVIDLKNPLDYTEANLTYNQVGMATIPDLVYDFESPEVPVRIKLVEVEGQADANAADNEYLSSFLSMADTGFKRAMLMEEVTGTWCGNCPRGIVAIKQMLEKYGEESFIPVAVHCGELDPMTCADYSGFINKYTGVAAPTAMFNRNTNYEVGLSGFGMVERIYKQITSQAALAKIDLSATWVDEAHTAVNVHASTGFSSDSDKEFRLAFVLTENGVGPYRQRNYYSGGQEMGGWEELSAYPEVTFDEVARTLDTFEGIEGSLPADGVRKDTTYDYDRLMSLAALDKTDDFAITAMVLDSSTGEVVNARRIKNSDIVMSSVRPVGAYDATRVEIVAVKGGICISGVETSLNIYTPDGKLAASGKGPFLPLPSGIYIVEAGETIAKVSVK